MNRPLWHTIATADPYVLLAFGFVAGMILAGFSIAFCLQLFGEARRAVGQRPTERGARNASHIANDAPTLGDQPMALSAPTRHPPPANPLFASDLTETSTSISAGQGDAT